MNDDSKLFKHPIQLNSKRHMNETIKKLQSTRPVNGQPRLKLRNFIPVVDEDETVPDVTQKITLHINQRENGADETLCADYTIHGRCLGFHRPNEVPNFNQTDIPSVASSNVNFDQGLNSSVAGLRNYGWNNHLNSMSQWAVKTWLKVCPQKCGDTTFRCKNQGGDLLASLINESTRETSTTSHSLSSYTALFHPKPCGSSATSIQSPNPSNIPPVHTTRVRIQQPPKLSTSKDSDLNVTPNKATLVLHSNVQDNKLESWHVVPVEGSAEVCVRGKLMRSRKIWRSGAIQRCKSPRSVITSTGTMYNLVGKPVNIDDVMPRYIEESFASGFPSNWTVLVKKWHQESKLEAECIASSEQGGKRTQKRKHLKSPVRSRKVRPSLVGDASGSESDNEASSVFNSSVNSHLTTPEKKLIKKHEILEDLITSESSESDANLIIKAKTPAKKTTPKINKTISISSKPKTLMSSDEVGKSSSDSEESEEEEKHNINQLTNCSVVLRKLDTTKKTRSRRPDDETELWLHHWRVIPDFNHHSMKVKLGGCLKNGTKGISKNHVSLPVEKRLGSSIVTVETGIKYHLMGTPLFKSLHGELILPKYIQQKFAKGFPTKWTTIIKAWYDENCKVLKDKQPIRVTKEKVVIKTRTRKTRTIITEKQGVDDTDDDMECKSLAGIKVATSSRGRRIIKPLKYWESEKLIVQGTKLYVRKENDHQLIESATPSPKADRKNHQRRFLGKPEVKKRNMEENKTKNEHVKAKKPRVTETKSPGKSKGVKQAKTKFDKTKPYVKSKTCKSPAEQHVTKSTDSDDGNSEFDDLDEEEIKNIMKSKPTNKKDRDKKEALRKHLEPKYTHKEVDLFANCRSASDDDDYSHTEDDDANDDQWEADSISSRVTSDDVDRITYNYTPPGARMWKLVEKSSPQKADLSMKFEDNKKKKRSNDFMQRQLKKTKTLSKKALAEQEATVSTTAKLMQYKNVNPTQKKIVNNLFENLTSGKPRDEFVAKFLKPEAPIDEDDSDSYIEPYHSEPENSDNENNFMFN